MQKKSNKSRFLMAGSVFAIALATGFVMQNGADITVAIIGSENETQVEGAAPADLEAEPPLAAFAEQAVPVAAPTEQPLAEPVAPAAVPADVQLAALDEADLPEDPVVKPLAQPQTKDLGAKLPDDTPSGTADAVSDQNAFSGFGLSCDVALTATASAAAMVDLELTAPCYGSSPVTVTHSGLKFTAATNDAGTLKISVPAMAEDAKFTLRLDTGAEAKAEVKVEDFTEFFRAAIQWQGSTGLQIHAFEFGSSYDDPGHVWAGSSHSPARGERRAGGFLTTLGVAAIPGAWVTEIYTFPSEGTPDQGVVRLNIEAEVTAQTCGRDVKAEVLQPGFDGTAEPVELTLSAMGCDTIGEFLVLKNVLRDLKLATN